MHLSYPFVPFPTRDRTVSAGQKESSRNFIQITDSCSSTIISNWSYKLEFPVRTVNFLKIIFICIGIIYII